MLVALDRSEDPEAAAVGAGSELCSPGTGVCALFVEETLSTLLAFDLYVVVADGVAAGDVIATRAVGLNAVAGVFVMGADKAATLDVAIKLVDSCSSVAIIS